MSTITRKTCRVAIFCTVDAEEFDAWEANCKDGIDANFAARLDEVYDDNGSPLVSLDVFGVDVEEHEVD